MNKEYEFLNPVGSTPELIQGRYGSARHAGNFREDNPYLEQLRMAIKNQDKDALYERAIEWEADVASRHMQIAENKEILDEQRWYDSPEQQIKRQREAGINPDLGGSSGSGGSGQSAQLANPGLPDVQAQTKFDNKYDNTALVLQGINTAAGLAQTFVSGYSSIIDSIDKFKTLPSRVSLNESTSKLRNAQANEIDTLLAGKKKGIDLSNAATALSTTRDLYGMLADTSDLISKDIGRDGIISTLSTLGIGENDEQRGAYADIIGRFHANPEYRAKYANDLVAANRAEVEAEQYTPEFFSGIVADEKRLMRFQLDWDVAYTDLQSKVAKMLNSYDHATGLADLEQSSLANQNLSLDIIGQQLELDFESIGLKLDECSKTIDEIDANIKAIDDNPKGRDGKLTSAQKILKARYEMFKSQLLTSGSEKLEQLYDIVAEVQRTKYTQAAYDVDFSGEPSRPTSSFGSFGGYMFDQIHDRKASFGEVAREIGGEVVIGLSMIGAAKLNSSATVKSSTIAAKSRVDAAKVARPAGYRKHSYGTKHGMKNNYVEKIDYNY